jgi:predicted small secreted protein
MAISSTCANSHNHSSEELSAMKTIATATLFAFALLLAGCNTIRGAGQDIQKAGEKIEDAAKKR